MPGAGHCRERPQTMGFSNRQQWPGRVDDSVPLTTSFNIRAPGCIFLLGCLRGHTFVRNIPLVVGSHRQAVPS